MPSLRLPGFHPALPIYRPYGTGQRYAVFSANPVGGAISVDRARHPHLQAPEERHNGNAGWSTRRHTCKTRISGMHRSTDMPSLRDWKPAHHLLFKPRRGDISVDTSRHPHLFKLRRSDITVTPGGQPGGSTRTAPVPLQSIIHNP